MINRKICRRDFLRMLAAATAATTIAPSVINATNTNSEAPHPTPLPAKKMPLWKGFNLLNKFNPDWQTPFEEKDFEIMAEWGFNFARIPLSYWCWSKEDDWYNVNEKILDEIDHVVELGKQYKIHVNLNFHRAPGYCINPPHGKTNLFEDEEPLKVAGAGRGHVLNGTAGSTHRHRPHGVLVHPVDSCLDRGVDETAVCIRVTHEICLKFLKIIAGHNGTGRV